MTVIFWGVVVLVLLWHLMNLITNPNETFWDTIRHSSKWNKGKDSMVFDRKTYTYAKDKK